MKQYEPLIARLNAMAAFEASNVSNKRTLEQAAEALEALQDIVGKQAHLNDTLLDDLLKMDAQLTKVEAVRDAALKDLLEVGKTTCAVCAHENCHPTDCGVECLECPHDCACKECRDGSKFLWRGISYAPEA